VSSWEVPIRVLPRSEEKLLEALEEGNSFTPPAYSFTKDYFLGGSMGCDVQLNKTTFTLGEKVKLRVAVDNTASPNDIRSVRVSLNDILTCAATPEMNIVLLRGMYGILLLSNSLVFLHFPPLSYI